MSRRQSPSGAEMFPVSSTPVHGEWLPASPAPTLPNPLIRDSKLLGSLNPLEPVIDVIDRILHYRLECKRLEQDQHRIDRAAELRHHQIDQTLQATLAWLGEKRSAAQRTIEEFRQDREYSQAQRTQLQDQIDSLIASITDPNLPSEHKRCCIAAIPLLTDLLKTLGDQNVNKLDTMARNVRKTMAALPGARPALSYRDDD